MEKQDILNEYSKAASLRGRTIGKAQFFKDAGIKESDWIKYWPRISEMQKEAGFAPNEFQDSLPEEKVLEAWVEILEKVGKIPTSAELRIVIRSGDSLPADKTLKKLGSNIEIAKRIISYCQKTNKSSAAVEICQKFLAASQENGIIREGSIDRKLSAGYVYLLKLYGNKYKVGRTENLERRLDQHRRLLPDLKYEWIIETDDPSGVESYWKRRFADKLEPKTEETFNLNPVDVAAFKRWIKIV